MCPFWCNYFALALSHSCASALSMRTHWAHTLTPVTGEAGGRWSPGIEGATEDKTWWEREKREQEKWGEGKSGLKRQKQGEGLRGFWRQWNKALQTRVLNRNKNVYYIIILIYVNDGLKNNFFIFTHYSYYYFGLTVGQLDKKHKKDSYAAS